MRRYLSVAVAVLGTVLFAACGAAHPAATHRRRTPSATQRPSPRSVTPTAPSTSAGPRPTPSPSADTRGLVVQRAIPGGASGFHARDAMIYLPAAARQSTAKLPVIELLHGTPGAPTSWLKGGGLRATLDAFATAHGGRAPIVVMPDINGTEHGDTECVTDPAGADVEQYLTVQVRDYVIANFPASANAQQWSVAGLSEGATCAVMLALRHPDKYTVFGEFSGLARPTVGENDDRARTIAELFHGSSAAYDAHDPIHLLATNRYPSLSGWFESGESDTATLQAEDELVALSRAAGIDVRASHVPGGHEWSVWIDSLQRMLPWLWRKVTG
jgi:S-formylglutathione hydrolase FrmB